uniref:Snaclec coagulation factor IX/factor X-binding protein subunit A n=1 Tax=Echis carinatus TaxID=40353 RepID=SL9A_ECHCA|nr:RecName: Full=Snaclec coagulation factor IX/factor X-binding protein subunit A; Short=IX/X-BP subunit A; AltName: Full=ECLV IX/X-BP subunit A [Echis carinatus]AAB36401.1 ECLV IX/X-bp alpha subunit=coagulation factor IX/factor X-binding protein alpha subunit [Echis carinatus=saw-scaled or carpet vipers, ssp. leucogaster, venom, Peptide, 131 aa] [Echis carinatus]
DCLPGWSSHEGHCYKVFNEYKTWKDAEKFCKKQGKSGHLVSVESSEEGDFVAKLISENLEKSHSIDFVWTGLTYKGRWKQCSSEWSDGSKIKYQKWGKQQPRKCLGLEKQTEFRKWVNLYCEEPQRFTCEI